METVSCLKDSSTGVGMILFWELPEIVMASLISNRTWAEYGCHLSPGYRRYCSLLSKELINSKDSSWVACIFLAFIASAVTYQLGMESVMADCQYFATTIQETDLVLFSWKDGLGFSLKRLPLTW